MEVFVRTKGSTVVGNQLNDPNPEFVVNEARFYALEDSGLESLFIQYAYDDNVPLIFNDFIDKKFKQKDIIKDLTARYNCLVYVNPEKL